MKQIVTAEQMRAYEGYLMETLGIPSLLLMERAAGYVHEQVCLYAKNNENMRVLIVAGYGNNGADGLAAARMLTEHKNIAVFVVAVGDPTRASGQWKIQAGILERMHISMSADIGEGLKTDPDVIVDGLFGIGINRDLQEVHLDAVRQINAWRKKNRECRVVSVDIPSGLHTDLGMPQPEAVFADVTVTFGFVKRGMYVNQGRRYTGEIICRPIGITRPDIADMDLLMDWSELRDLRPKRDVLGHKGTFGKVLCISGSEDMPGAAIMNAGAALRCGAGMVKVLSVPQNRDLLLRSVPEAMFVPMSENGAEYDLNDADETRLEEELAWADVVLIGSGLTKTRAGRFLASRSLRQCDLPMVIDADGLNALAMDMDFLLDRKARGCVTYLTPHPGEFVRLFPEKRAQDGQHPYHVRQLAKEYGVVLVAKSATTLVTNGEKVYYNTLGSDALAKAGSGDVLAGTLAACACVIKDPLEAAVYADALHAVTGAYVAKERGSAGVNASDLIDAMPRLMEQVAEG